MKEVLKLKPREVQEYTLKSRYEELPHAGKHGAPITEVIEWAQAHCWCESGDVGNIATDVKYGAVIPIWCPQNSLFITRGSFQQNMVRWTDRRHDMLNLTSENKIGIYLSNHFIHYGSGDPQGKK
ncbi:MAG: hypothetical protein ACKPKO_57450, partial [Candidatus Fonsibacter sp.]